jgi:hypothetical protein
MSDSSPSPAPAPVAPPEPRKRRLVPDEGDSIEVPGQRLVRVKRVEEEKDEAWEQKPRTIDDVARKHLSPDLAEAIAENSDLLRQIADDKAAPPPIADLVSRFEIVTDGDAVVPHPEANPEKRPEDVITVSPIIATEDAPDFLRAAKAPETIFDLFNMFPELDGVNQYIYVERKDPKNYAGRKVAGMMRPITRPITLSEWQEIYGGGTYRLIVYGSPKRGGRMMRDGRMSLVKLTDPITVVFPGIPSGDAEVYDEEEAMNAPEVGGARRGPASIADAQIAKTNTEAQLTREERQANERKEKDLQLEAERKKREQDQAGVAGQIAQMATQLAAQQAEFRRESLAAEREHAREIRQMQERFEEKLEEKLADKKPERSELDTALALSQNLTGGNKGSAEALESLRTEHARELDRIQRQISSEHDRSEARVKDERERCDRIIREAEARADARIKEVEERYRNLERDLRERSDREIQRVKDEADRRVTDLQHQHTIASTSEDRNHKRDMEMLQAQHASAIDALKNTYEMRLETARGEVKRTAGDVERYKQEAEKNKDPVAQIKKIKENAAELGMIDASDAPGAEPETITQMLARAAIGVGQNLPGIIENVGNVFKGRSAQELQAARIQGRQEMVDQASQGFPPQGLPPPHARRRGGPPQLGGGGWVPRHMSEVGPMPVGPGADPFVVPPQHVQFQAEVPRMPEPEIVQTTGLPVQQQPQGQGFTHMPPEPQMSPARPQAPAQAPPQLQQLASIVPASAPPPAPPPSMPPPPSAQAAPGPVPAEIAEDREILQAEQLLLPNYTSSVPPNVVAEGLLQQFGLEAVTGLVGQINAERVIVAIQRSGDPNSPFLRRDGKKYLRALFEELQRRVRPS